MLLAKKFAYALACAAVLFAACSDDDKPVLPEEEVSEKTVEAIVVNEGQWTKNLGSISAIYSDGTVDADIFRQVNNRPLGDVAQDIALINGAYFVPINNSHIIQVVDAKTFESKATILAPDITPTRIVAISDTEALVSAGYGKGFVRISTVEPYGEATPEGGREVLEYIQTSGAGHYMAAVGNKLAVSTGSSTKGVVIYDLNKLNAEGNTLAVPHFGEKAKLLKDKNNIVWAIGEYKPDANTKVIRCSGIDLAKEAVVSTIDIPEALNATSAKVGDLISVPSYNRTDIANNKLYFPVNVATEDGDLVSAEQGVYEVDVETGTYRLYCMTPDLGMMFGFGVSPAGDVYVGDCINWSAQQGYVRIYDRNGAHKDIKVGLYPTEFCFPDKQ